MFVGPFARLFSALVVVAFAGQSSAEDLPASTTLNPLAKLDPSSFKAFVEQPLFSPTRSRPDDDNSAEAAPPREQKAELDILLLGVVISPEGSVARIKDNGDQSTHSLAVGDVYKNWKVAAIEAAQIRMSDGSETVNLAVFAKGRDDIKTVTTPRLEQQADELPAADMPRQKVRIIGTWPGAKEETSETSSEKTRHEQDLIDFFGKADKPADQ